MRIPRFVNEFFERQDFSCPKCHTDFDVRGVVFLGIKPVSHVPGRVKDMLYTEYVCSKCKEKVGYEIIDMTLKEFASAIMDDPIAEDEPESESQPKNIFSTEHIDDPEKAVSPPSKPMKPAPKVKSKITLEEKKAAINSLENCNTWTDLLKRIGLPAEGQAGTEHRKDQSFRLSNSEEDNNEQG